MAYTQISQIKIFFYTENTLPDQICKPKDQMATEDKNNTVYKN